MRILFLILALLIAVPSVGMAQYVFEVPLVTGGNLDSLGGVGNSDSLVFYISLENRYQITQTDSLLGWLYIQVASSDGAVKFDIDAASGFTGGSNDAANDGIWETDIVISADNGTETPQNFLIDKAEDESIAPNYVRLKFTSVELHRDDSIITASFFYMRKDN